MGYVERVPVEVVQNYRMRDSSLAGFTDDVLTMVAGYGQKLDESLEAIQRIDRNTEAIKPYVPWMTFALGLVGVGLVLNAIKR